MDIGTLRGLLTAALLVLFLGIVVWAYSRRRRVDFDKASRLPLEEHERPPADDGEDTAATGTAEQGNRQ